LGRYIQHSSHFTQHGLAIVLVLIAFDGDHPVGLVNEEVDPGELLRPLPAERDHGFSIGGVTDGGKEFVHSLFPFLPSLVSPLSVVPFDMQLQIVCLDVASLTVLSSTHEWTVVVVNHRVPSQICPLFERHTTSRDLAMIRPLTGVGSHVIHQGVP
jgi:hypothetical protein